MAANTLADIIRGPALSIAADAEISEALRLMGERRISCLLVERDGAVCGIVTEKDLVRTYAGVAGHARNTVAEIMTAAPFTWHFTVSDNGIGIEPQYLERIFGLFVRLHPAGAYGGSGVGLAICRRLAGLLGGRVWVESTPDQGSRFHLTVRKQPAG